MANIARAVELSPPSASAVAAAEEPTVTRRHVERGVRPGRALGRPQSSSSHLRAVLLGCGTAATPPPVVALTQGYVAAAHGYRVGVTSEIPESADVDDLGATRSMRFAMPESSRRAIASSSPPAPL
jgi:hypothetical protein